MFSPDSASSDFGQPELDRVFLRNYDRLLAFSRKNCRNLGDAEEFVHEAYLRSRRGWCGSRQSQERPESYFFRSLRWALADALRRKAREASLDRIAILDTRHRSRPEEDAAARESFETALSPAEQELFRAMMHGRTEAQLCRELEVSPGALAVRICRARKKLEACLGIRRLQSSPVQLHCNLVSV